MVISPRSTPKPVRKSGTGKRSTTHRLATIRWRRFPIRAKWRLGRHRQCERVRPEDGRPPLAMAVDPQTRRARQRHVERRFLEARRRRGVERHGDRCRERHALFNSWKSISRPPWESAAGAESLHRFDGGTGYLWLDAETEMVSSVHRQ